MKIEDIIQESTFIPIYPDDKLRLVEVQLKPEYAKEWNEHVTDFIVLVKNGEILNNALYRIGGFGTQSNKLGYFNLIKYVENIYTDEFIKMCYPNKTKKEQQIARKYLAGNWTILDKEGNEKIVFEQYKSPYISGDSCIYSINSNYYNIETNEFYCHSSNTMETDTYILLENNYDKDISRRGIMQINKIDGTWNLMP